MRQRELSEIKTRVGAMLKEFEAADANEAAEMLSMRQDDLDPEERVEADGYMLDGRPVEATRTVLNAAKRRTGAAMGELQHGNSEQVHSLELLEAWFDRANDEHEELGELLRPLPAGADESLGSAFLAKMPERLSERGRALAKAHATVSKEWQQTVRRLTEESAAMRKLADASEQQKVEAVQRAGQLALEVRLRSRASATAVGGRRRRVPSPRLAPLAPITAAAAGGPSLPLWPHARSDPPPPCPPPSRRPPLTLPWPITVPSRRLRRRVWAQKQAAAKSQGPDLSRALREVQEKVTKLEQELEDGKGDRLGRKQAEAALRRQADHSQTLQAQLDAMQAELMQAPPRPDRVRSPLLELRPLLHKLRIRRC